MNKSEKFWDKISNRYDNLLKKYEQTYIKTIENTKKYLNNNDIVLDYACGTGIIATEISNSVKKIHAIDISSKMIDIAKRKSNERKIENINFSKTDILDERYKKESFNVILVFNILYLLSDVHKIIERINELLKPEGLFISATDCLGEKKTLLNRLKYFLSKIGILPFMKMLKISELENIIITGNFKIIETEILNNTTPNYFVVSRKIERT
ncbi:hypothetical protein AMJ86_02135 [bacterium SM23_57]|nr:MAG: hypothetical protein AMJ86_02135 [bacterium SM23_57]